MSSENNTLATQRQTKLPKFLLKRTMTEDAEDKRVTDLSYESKPARVKEREIASGVHILTSDNPASCV